MGDGGLARIRNDLVNNLIKDYGEGAYTYALQKMATYEDDEFMLSMWRSVVNEIDEHFKGEGQ
jgi:hypothetical protein